MRKPNYLLLGAVGAAALVSACGSGAGTSTAGDGQVAFHVAGSTAASAAAASSPAIAADLVARGNDTLDITGVQLVLRRIKLESAADAACEDDDGHDHRGDDFGGHRDSINGGLNGGLHDDSTHHDSTDDHGHSATSTSECGEVKLGPVLVDLPLNSGVTHAFDATLPAGTYHELHFQVSPVRSSDTAFVAAHPDLAGVSIKVTGTFNKTPFTYTTDLKVGQNVHLSTPLDVAASGTTSLTLRVDLSNWFVGPTGALIDPASALKGGANETVVANGIRASFHAFHDSNHDGHED